MKSVPIVVAGDSGDGAHEVAVEVDAADQRRQEDHEAPVALRVLAGHKKILTYEKKYYRGET